jgi:hypothetical protein
MKHGFWAAVLATAVLGLVGAEPSRPGGPPSFHGTSSRIGHSLRARLTSWRRGCPVPVSALRLLRINYVGFDGQPHEGEMIVHHDWAQPVLRVFRKLYDARFPIRRMKLVEAYASNDDRVDLADDTSGFNCRYVRGTTTWSEHAFGRAIDIDPLENPYVVNGKVSNRAYRPFVDRSHRRPGMIHPGGPVVRAFAAIGWRWGGNWHGLIDYMHFSATGR